MSVASANFFAALQDDSAAQGVHLERQPGVAVSTSSKKTDRAPAKADPSRARPKAANPSASDAAFRNKEAGRNANKQVPVGEEATSTYHRSARAERTDRVKRTAKKDSSKKVRAGWGDNRKEGADEVAAEKIAAEDRAADASDDDASADAEPAVPTQTLEQYLQERAAQDSALNLNVQRAASRQANEGADNSQWADAKALVKEEDAAPTRRKNLRTKNQKELPRVLEITPADPPRRERAERSERSERPGRGERRPARGNGERSERSERRPARGGDRSGAKGDRKPKGDKPARSSKPAAPKVDLTALPKLG